MKPCDHKIKMTPEEEKALNESVFKILCDGLDIVRTRFPHIGDVQGEICMSESNGNDCTCKPQS